VPCASGLVTISGKALLQRPERAEQGLGDLLSNLVNCERIDLDASLGRRWHGMPPDGWSLEAIVCRSNHNARMCNEQRSPKRTQDVIASDEGNKDLCK
jgi:hypothetical protein